MTPHETLDIIRHRAVLLAIEPYRKQVVKWIGELKKLKSYKDFKGLSPVSEEIRQVFELIFQVYYFFGSDVAGTEIEILKLFEREKQEKSIEKEPLKKTTFGLIHINFAVWEAVNWETIGFQAALDRFLKKKIIPGPEFKAAAAEIKAITFSVQRVEDVNALMVINESIEGAIQTGMVFQDWQDELPTLFENAGYVVKDPKLTPWHLENVFRTNEASVYEAAKWDGYHRDPYVDSLQFNAILDPRVRDTHRALDGVILPKNHPRWSEIYPPLDYQCRCSTSPLSKYYMDKKKLKHSKLNKKQRESIGKLGEDFRGKNGVLGLKEKLKTYAEKKERGIMTKEDYARKINDLNPGMRIDKELSTEQLQYIYEDWKSLADEGYNLTYKYIEYLPKRKSIMSSNNIELWVNFKSIKTLKEKVKRGIRSGWWASCRESDYVKNLITHEYAHHLSYAYFQARPDFSTKAVSIFNKYKKAMLKASELERKKIFISSYAKKNVQEFAAEAFAMYKHSDTPSPFAIEVGELFNEYFKKGD